MADPVIQEVLPDFQLAGETLLACGCNNSHSGNLSVRRGEQIVITRTGAMLASLTADDLVLTSDKPTEAQRRRASSELFVHLKTYERTQHRAIAHGHALSAIAVAWRSAQIKPIDVEGAYYFGSIPVLEHTPATAVPALGKALANMLADQPVVVLRGHGVFAAADSLERAVQRITSVNNSAELIIKAKQLGLDIRSLEQAPYLRQEKVSG